MDAFLVGSWCRLSGKDKALTQRTRRARSSQRRNRKVVGWQSIGVRDRGRICWRVVRTRERLPVSPRLQKQDQYTGKWNEVKRIIVPSGYSNEMVGWLRRWLSRRLWFSWGNGGGCGSRGSDCGRRRRRRSGRRLVPGGGSWRTGAESLRRAGRSARRWGRG